MCGHDRQVSCSTRRATESYIQRNHSLLATLNNNHNRSCKQFSCNYCQSGKILSVRQFRTLSDRVLSSWNEAMARSMTKVIIMKVLMLKGMGMSKMSKICV